MKNLEYQQKAVTELIEQDYPSAECERPTQ